MRKALHWLVNNLGLIALSLALALLVWAAAIEQDNPTSERRYSSPIPVTLFTPPLGMVAYGYDASAQVFVTLRAPESVWRSLQATDFRAFVDLSDLGPGDHRVPIQVQVNREPVMVRRVEPDSLFVRLEAAGQRTVPVQVRLEGDTALGYLAREPAISPPVTTVSGPASLVGQVVEAVARVSVAGARADIESEFVLEALDANGELVPYTTLDPPRLHVRVPVEQLSGFRDVAVTALLEGQVAPGYRISSITVNPPVVTVYGAPEAIAQIPGYLETAPLNLDNAQGNVEVEMALTAPEGISLLPPVVTVRVTIRPQEGSLTVARPVEIQGLSQPGITATVAPTMAQVILSGPLPVLQQLRQEDVRIIINLSGLGPGSHQIEPQVAVTPRDVVVESVLPASVQVVITLLVTPTPGR